MTTAYIAMGTNVGDRQAAIEHARTGLDAIASAPIRMSEVYETAPVGGPAGQGAFLNAVAELQTTLPPRDLLARLQAIEQAAGREPPDQRVRWSPRVLDLDILFYGDAVIDEPGLRVPHPHLHERWFVLKPLADLAPQLVHPTRGETVAAMLANLPTT
ncbi:MAG: 2-amino-4-hydroxy-6-hydroxymethyldihydropteridine diphosphokinase [Phycisphaeraceae bacterium]